MINNAILGVIAGARVVATSPGVPSWHSTSSRDDSSSVSSFLLALPGSGVSGLFFVALVMSRAGATISGSGWSLAATSDFADFGQRIEVFTKLKTSEEVDVTISSAGAAGRMDAVIFAYTYTGNVVPYVDNFNTDTGLTTVVGVGLAATKQGVMVSAVTNVYRNTAGGTTTMACTASINGAPAVSLVGNAAYESVWVNSTSSNGTRIRATTKSTSSATGTLHNPVTYTCSQSVPTQPALAAIIFNLTCGLS